MVRGGGLGLVECQPVEQGLSQRTRGSGPGVRAPKRAFPRGKGWGYGGDCRCCHFTLRSSAPQGNRRTVSGASKGGRGGVHQKSHKPRNTRVTNGGSNGWAVEPLW